MSEELRITSSVRVACSACAAAARAEVHMMITADSLSTTCRKLFKFTSTTFPPLLALAPPATPPGGGADMDAAPAPAPAPVGAPATCGAAGGCAGGTEEEEERGADRGELARRCCACCRRIRSCCSLCCVSEMGSNERAAVRLDAEKDADGTADRESGAESDGNDTDVEQALSMCEGGRWRDACERGPRVDADNARSAQCLC
mmetsp:Transcript_12222/g.36998  ORF Transcript_12222/g.36998 Transcript_12222/m.36998 type:complete len:202 (+) Transcript_12222:802-1407(+)